MRYRKVQLRSKRKQKEESEEEQRETTHRPRSGECVEEKRESVHCLFGSKEVEWWFLDEWTVIIESSLTSQIVIPWKLYWEVSLNQLVFYQVEGWDGDDG